MSTAEEAFAVLDKDVNGDVSLEELEMACLWVSSLFLSVLSHNLLVKYTESALL